MLDDIKNFEEAFLEQNETKQVSSFDNWLKREFYHSQENVNSWLKLMYDKKYSQEVINHILDLYFHQKFENYPNTTKVIINEFANKIIFKFHLPEIFKLFEENQDRFSLAKIEILFKAMQTYSNVITLPEANVYHHNYVNSSVAYLDKITSSKEGSRLAKRYIESCFKEKEDYVFSSKTSLSYVKNFLNNFSIPLATQSPALIYKVKKANTIKHLLDVGYKEVLKKNEVKTEEYLFKLFKDSSFEQFNGIYENVEFSPNFYKNLSNHLETLYDNRLGNIKKEKLDVLMSLLQKRIFEASLEPINIESKKIKL